MSHAPHRLALIALLAAALGCTVKPEPVAREGKLVLGPAAAPPLVARDTLNEVALSSLPPAVQAVWHQAADQVQGPAACTRAFKRDSMYLLRVLPWCGREPSGDDWLAEWANIVVMTSGRVVDSGSSVAFAIATLCPAGRDLNGQPFFGSKYRLDGCERSGPEVAIDSMSIGIRTSRGVILPEAVRRGLLEQCSRETPVRADFEWMPTPADVERLEEDLGPFVKVYAPARVASSWTQYGRQYGGFGVGLDTLIYVSFAARFLEDSSVWMRMPIKVCDGGEGFWGIVYDPRTRTFTQMRFNGTA